MEKRHDAKIKHNATIVTVIVIFVLSIIFVYGFYVNSSFHQPLTPVYKLAYNLGDKDEYILPQVYPYDEDSPEDLFARGLKSFSLADYNTAGKLFSDAVAKLEDSSDAALPFYLYCYLNQCEQATTGEGNLSYVDKAVNASMDYLPAMDDHFHFWQAIYSIAVDERTDSIALEYLEKALSYSNKLSTD